jgi:RND family efflux transporter MFP subunit
MTAHTSVFCSDRHRFDGMETDAAGSNESCTAHRTWFWAICTAIALAGCSKPAPAPPTPSLTVQTTLPQSRLVDRQVTASGAVAAWEEMAVGVELSGLRVAAVEVEVGDRVRRGQTLLRLDTRTLEAQSAQAEAAQVQAEADLDVAVRKARRARELAAGKFIAAQDAEELAAAEISARAQVGSARAARDSARVQLGFATVNAPDDGVVSARSVQPGQVVAAGTELLRLIRQGRLEWRAELAEQDLIRVQPGATVRVVGPGGVSIDGRVRQVAPALDPQRRTGTVYVDLPEPGALRAGMFAQGRLLLGQAQAMVIPLEAVVRRDGRAYVFVVDANARVQERRIEVGAQIDSTASATAVSGTAVSGTAVSGTAMSGMIEVRSGLRTNERVVARGAGFLGDGDLVRVVDGKATDAKTVTALSAVAPAAGVAR